MDCSTTTYTQVYALPIQCTTNIHNGKHVNAELPKAQFDQLEKCVYIEKMTGTPSHYKNVPVKKLHPINEKYEGRSY